jgi:hypothetical protein
MPVHDEQEVLRRGLDAFAELGYEQTSVRELARRLGTSHNSTEPLRGATARSRSSDRRVGGSIPSIVVTLADPLVQLLEKCRDRQAWCRPADGAEDPVDAVVGDRQCGDVGRGSVGDFWEHGDAEPGGHESRDHSEVRNLGRDGPAESCSRDRAVDGDAVTESVRGVDPATFGSKAGSGDAR